MDLFIQHMFIEYVLSAKHNSRYKPINISSNHGIYTGSEEKQ